MEDKMEPVEGNTGDAEKNQPPTSPEQGKGSNDPNFAGQDSADKKKPEDKSSRELPPDPNFAPSEDDIHKEEDLIDPGNEHHH